MGMGNNVDVELARDGTPTGVVRTAWCRGQLVSRGQALKNILLCQIVGIVVQGAIVQLVELVGCTWGQEPNRRGNNKYQNHGRKKPCCLFVFYMTALSQIDPVEGDCDDRGHLHLNRSLTTTCDHYTRW